MSVLKFKSAWLALAVTLLGPPYEASSANSTSQVFIACASLVRGATNTEGVITPVPLPFVRPSVFEGTVSQINSNRIVVATGAWVPNEFALCYVEFASGQMAGVLTNDLNSLTLDSAPQVALGVRFRIRPAHTIASVFGSGGAVTAGDTIDTADNVLLFDASIQATRTIFLSTNNAPAWSDQDGADSADANIPARHTVLVKRRATNDAILVAHGVVSPGACYLNVFEGLNWLSTPCIGGSFGLDQLRLFNGNAVTGLGSGPDATTADTLVTFSPDGQTTTFFYSTASGFTGWRDLSLASATTNRIGAGVPLLIHRQSPRQAFVWRSPIQP